jgi:1,2-diacylglycerol 3-beta-galactosyltransferase
VTDKKRILILTADAGFGHRSAANATALALTERHGADVECLIVNPVLERQAPNILRSTMLNYDKTVRNTSTFYRLTYKISDFTLTSRILEAAMFTLQARLLHDLIIEVKPDAVICTYHLFNSAAVAAIRQCPGNPPFFIITTDLARIHKLWFRPIPTLLFASSDQVMQEALENGIPQERVILSGIPVKAALADRSKGKSEIRKELGWNPNLKTILIVGSRRVENILPCLQAMDNCKYPVQFVVVAGGDNELDQKLHEVSFQTPVILYNYVDNLAQMMLAADILFSKAGGLIISEGLAAGLPMILIGALPGQESGNLDYVCSRGAAVTAHFMDEIRSIVNEWLVTRPEAYEYTAEKSRSLGKPDAAYTIAETVWKTLKTL